MPIAHTLPRFASKYKCLVVSDMLEAFFHVLARASDSPVQPHDLFAIAVSMQHPKWCAAVIVHYHESKVYTDLRVPSPWGGMHPGEGLHPARFSIKLWRQVDDEYLLAVSRSSRLAKDSPKAKARSSWGGDQDAWQAREPAADAPSSHCSDLWV